MKNRTLELAGVISEANYRSTYPEKLKNKNKYNDGLTQEELANHIHILKMTEAFFGKPFSLLDNSYHDFDKKDHVIIEQFRQFLKSLQVPRSLLDLKKEKPRKVRRD